MAPREPPSAAIFSGRKKRTHWNTTSRITATAHTGKSTANTPPKLLQNPESPSVREGSASRRNGMKQ